jgi:FlaA1/EpsC-like NDP-sugar epimerase
MSRLFLRTSQLFVDLAVLALAFALAFLLRFDGQLPHAMFKRLFLLMPYVALLQYGVLTLWGTHRFPWRYIGLREAVRFSGAIASAALLLGVLRLGADYLLQTQPMFRNAAIPWGVLIIDAGLAFGGLVGVRAAWRILTERMARKRREVRFKATTSTATLLVGAGLAGVQVAKEIANRPELGFHPVGFVDDDPRKLGSVIHGIRVLGTTKSIIQLAQDRHIDDVLITIAKASGQDIRRIVELCDKVGLRTRIIPGLSELLDGRVSLNRIRPISIEDLLGRAAISLEMDAVSSLIQGKTIVVTGAGGSIGSELCRQVARLKPSKLLLIERAEAALFEIHRELSEYFPDTTMVPALADVTDAKRITNLFKSHRPKVIFHAAAHKHVPMVESNPGEAIKNNVFGSKTIADIADQMAVSTFVQVSTDKAVNPTSVMGASKRVAELYMQGMSERSSTNYISVRFGNVLGSAGSVIPVFRKQIKSGGPVTVTHPEMKRYFMTIPEASQLVIQAGAMGTGGEIFVLDMGEPVKIVDLACDLIKLSGFEPFSEIPIVFSGIRPGEKLFEELSFDAEKMDKTRHPKIFVGKLQHVSTQAFECGLEQLSGLTEATSRKEVLDALRSLVPEMQDDAQSSGDASVNHERIGGLPVAATLATSE